MLCLRRLVGEGAVLARQLENGPWSVWSTTAKTFSQARPSTASQSDTAWKTLQEQGFEVNPCGSKFHPAVKLGLVPSAADAEKVKSLQDAYAPWSTCFGCGPSAGHDGLHLRSYRCEDGLDAQFSIPDKFCSFPGVVSGGVISTMLDCHGNWTAAVALMDEACLPKPPLTMTFNMNITYKLPTPPDTPLLLRARTVSIQRPSGMQSKVTLEVALELYRIGPAPSSDYHSDMESDDESESETEAVSQKRELVVSATAIYKRLGALRAF